MPQGQDPAAATMVVPAHLCRREPGPQVNNDHPHLRVLLLVLVLVSGLSDPRLGGQGSRGRLTVVGPEKGESIFIMMRCKDGEGRVSLLPGISLFLEPALLQSNINHSMLYL